MRGQGHSNAPWATRVPMKTLRATLERHPSVMASDCKFIRGPLPAPGHSPGLAPYHEVLKFLSNRFEFRRCFGPAARCHQYQSRDLRFECRFMALLIRESTRFAGLCRAQAAGGVLPRGSVTYQAVT